MILREIREHMSYEEGKRKKWGNLTGKGTERIIQRENGEINHAKNI